MHRGPLVEIIQPKKTGGTGVVGILTEAKNVRNGTVGMTTGVMSAGRGCTVQRTVTINDPNHHMQVLS